MRAAVLWLALAGCGGGDGTCAPDGTGDASGAVRGESLGPIVAAYETRVNGGVAIALADAGEACQTAATGKDLAILLCAAPTTARYKVLGDADFVCPVAGAFALFEHDGGQDFAASVSGALTIDRADDDCLHGTYAIDFDLGGTLSGSFDAVICD